MTEPIKIWSFYDAPAEYKRLSNHGGDEDIVILVPLDYKDTWIPGFGQYNMDDRTFSLSGNFYDEPEDGYYHPDGFVFIFAHG